MSRTCSRFTAVRWAGRLLCCFVLVCLCIVAFQSPLKANSVWDVANDFSATQNPSGDWSYGWSSTLGGACQNFNTTINNAGLDTWMYNYDGGNASLAHNGTGNPWSDLGNHIYLATNEMHLHPGYHGEFAIARWVAPSGSLPVFVQCSFSGLDDDGVTTDVHVLLNGSSLFAGNVIGYGLPSLQSYSTPLTVSGGDTIDFVVGWGTGSWWDDSTALSAQISSVPEPSALALLGSGAVCLLALGWRRRRKLLTCVLMVLGIVLAASAAQADVFNLGGTRDANGHWTGLASLETVPVGDPGNTGEGSGMIYGGSGLDRICGAVNYDYRIGKYEVTAGQYTEFLNAVAKADTYGLYNASMWSNSEGCKIQQSGPSGSYVYTVASGYENRPVNYVSWGDSARFANWLHNGQPLGTLTGNPVLDAGLTEDGSYYLNGATSNADLLAVNRNSTATWVVPTEDEWYKAAYYKGGSTNAYWHYPTSNNNAPGTDMADALGNNANYAGNTVPIDSPYYTTVAGEFQNSESLYGTFDQGGNVTEWTETGVWFNSVLSWHALRGGSFNAGSSSLLASNRLYTNPTYEMNYVGFRVASVPEPGSISLLLVGAIGLFAYAWRRRRQAA
jgi:formylglycine-generating enzyme